MNRIENATVFAGQVAFQGGVSFPSAAINPSAMGGTPADPVAAEKLEQQVNKTYAQPNTAAADETRVLHIAEAAGELIGFRVGSIAKAVGDATCTFDLLKNGTTMLSAAKEINSSNTNRVAVDATLSVTSYSAGDCLEVVINGTIGTGTLPTGCFCQLICREAAE